MSNTRQDLIRAYHARTKHRFEHYANGPDALDWDAQPAAFRHYPGAPSIELPLADARFERPYSRLPEPPESAVAANLDSLSALLELSFGISAWKRWGPSRWALRCNPSSGNLHPVEAYVLAGNFAGIASGLHHYDPEDHQLEGRALLPTANDPPWLAVGLSSIMWREAWKYGERAFRYCQLDIGHAVGALAYAAALLGWEVRPVGIASVALKHLLGLNRADDFPPSRYNFTEAETPEILLAIRGPGLNELPAVGELQHWLDQALWQGKPSVVDPSPAYRWSTIQEVAVASETLSPGIDVPVFSPLPELSALPAQARQLGAAGLIRQRRSAQRFDPGATLPKASFYRMLDATLPRPHAPWLSIETPTHIHLVLFVLRVDGLPSGLYLLPRMPSAAPELRAALKPGARFDEQRAVSDFDPECPGHLGLVQLAEVALPELQRLARTLSCHQDIASTSAFSLGMISEFAAATARPEGYRHAFREAGLVGQVLYLEAEAAGVRGTGIGCYFDDPVHEVFGLAGERYQSLYHFTVGTPITDARIETEPPYPTRHKEQT